MNNTARAIIKIDDKYVFIRREKKINNETKIFYAIVGGHLEENETFEDACVREVYEELGINIEIDYLFHEEYVKEIDKYEKFYMAKYIDGKLGSGKGEEFTNVDIEKYGKYDIVCINKNDLVNYDILPTTEKEKLIKEIK